MDLYLAHYVHIRAEDRDKAEAILKEHDRKGDLDDYSISTCHLKDNDGNPAVAYWIKPYVYEDFETILNEFKEAGIRIV